MNIIQLTPQPLTETVRVYIDALRACFDDVKIWTGESLDNKAKYPTGSLDVSMDKPVSLSSLKRKRLKKILEQIPEGETIVLTDWLSPAFFSSRMLKKYKVPISPSLGIGGELISHKNNIFTFGD